jgi:hypothetical protein
MTLSNAAMESTNTSFASIFYLRNSHKFGNFGIIKSPPIYARRAGIAQSVL